VESVQHVRVIYTASSIALACLENLVHRTGEGLNANFRLVEIAIPDDMPFDIIHADDLPENWHKTEGYPLCQAMGKEWVDQNKACLLQVPSSIIPDETNVLINPGHPDFGQISH
jgi:RES domain-containing protein